MNRKIKKFGMISLLLVLIIGTSLFTNSPINAQDNRVQPPDGVFENRNLNKPIQIDGDITIEGDIGPDGNVNGNGNLTIGGNVEGTISINGNVNIGGSIEPGANISLETPGTTLNVEAGMNGGNIEVSAGNVEINIEENLEAGNISATGENSRVNIGDSIGPNSRIEGIASVNVSKNASGEIDVSGEISIGENLKEEGRLVSEGNISIGGDLEEEGSVTLETPGKTLEIGRTLRGRATVTENAKVSIGDIPAESPVNVSVNASPLDGVEISVQNYISDLDIDISNLKGDVNVAIEKPEGEVYNIQQIDVETEQTTISEDEIEEAKIVVDVEKSWLQEHGIEAETVRVNRFLEDEGEWKELPTEVIGENSTHVKLEAETPGFSTFSITGEASPEEGAAEELPWLLIGGVVIIIIVIIMAIVAISRR